MKKHYQLFCFLLMLLALTACGKKNDNLVSNNAINADSIEEYSEENDDADMMAEANAETVKAANEETKNTDKESNSGVTTRTVAQVSISFEVTGDINVYDYGYVDGAREYVLKEDVLVSGTLIHAYGETSDGYYQIEYGTEWGYILKDNENLSETDIGYVLIETDKEYELLCDYIPYAGPSVHYDKNETTLLKGETVHVIGVAENGWLKTEEGYFISYNGYLKEKNNDSTQATQPTDNSQTTQPTDNSQTTPPVDNSQTTQAQEPTQTTTGRYYYNHPEAANMTLSQICEKEAPYIGDDGQWHIPEDYDLWVEDENTRYQEAVDKGWEIPW